MGSNSAGIAGGVAADHAVVDKEQVAGHGVAADIERAVGPVVVAPVPGCAARAGKGLSPGNADTARRCYSSHNHKQDIA